MNEKKEEISKREKDRQQKRENVNEKVKPWNIGLMTNVAALESLADLEWNFESFYNKVRKFAPSVSREELKEFLKHKAINLKNRPKPKGNLI